MTNLTQIRPALPLIILALCLAPLAQAELPSGIHVTGRGTVDVVPDMGRVQLLVRREGTQPAGLKTDLDEVVAAVLRLTRKLNILERDVTATALNISPRYQRRDNESVVEGLIATRSIEITLRDLDRFTELVNESLALGVNNTSPIRPDTSRRAQLEDEALTLAMEDASSEAAKVAAGFGVELGPVSDVQVGGHNPRPGMMRSMAEANADPSFSTGVITIERTVNATFSIIPGK